MKTRIFALAMPASALQASTYTLPYLPVSVLTLTAIYDAPAFGIPAPFLGSGGSDVEVWQFDHRDGHVVAHASFFLAWNVLTPQAIRRCGRGRSRCRPCTVLPLRPSR